jgi:hypothetical protein
MKRLVGHLLLIAGLVAGCTGYLGASPSATPLPTERGVLLRVGTDIMPGTYRATGVSGIFPCYWERRHYGKGGRPAYVSDAGEFEYLTIAAGFDHGPVTIEPTDDGFYYYNCGVWVRQ